MSTVPKAGDPAPANNSHETLVSDPWSGNYGRPTAGGAVTGNDQGAGPGPTAQYQISMPGAPVNTGDTQAGPDMGSGATIVVEDSGNMPSGGNTDPSSGGTVGDSGPQGAGPGNMVSP